MTTLPPIQEQSAPSMAAPKPQPGRGTRLTANSLGWSISASPGGGSFSHPFTPLLGASSIKFSRGLVESFEPVIGKVPISGDSKNAQPALKLDASKANANGESWACLEVTPNAKGELDAQSRIEVVHTNEPFASNTLPLGRQPLALILWQNGRPYRAFAIVRFNLRYVRFVPSAGGGSPKHFFL